MNYNFAKILERNDCLKSFSHFFLSFGVHIVVIFDSFLVFLINEQPLPHQPVSSCSSPLHFEGWEYQHKQVRMLIQRSSEASSVFCQGKHLFLRVR